MATGRPDDGWLGNYVDLDHLSRIAEPRQRPKRWLVICQKQRCLKQLVVLARLAWRHGARLTAVGPRVLRRITNIPDEASRHDLVFASARCALEAAATGAGVVVTDYRGDSGCLTPQNVQKTWQHNFGGEAFVRPLSIDRLSEAISHYDANAATEAGIWLRQNANLDAGFQRMQQIQQKALEKRCA